MSRVLVAMSGGVDSSVAAALLVQEGHDVTGVHLKLAEELPSRSDGGRVHGCCSVEDADDARRVAQVLDIPFYVWNLADTFKRSVVDDFVDSYAAGTTPNPCVRCNETVKFGAVLERGVALGFDYVATGHYAVVRHSAETSGLFRSADERKDQSYVLSTVGLAALRRSLFPVGAMRKEQTRAIANDLSLRTANKPESYDICFVADGDTGGFVERAGARVAPGPIVDADGIVVGEHAGIHRYTVGQRRGLGLGTAERRFVLDVDAARNTVVVGAGELLARTRIDARRVTWLVPVERGREVSVQIRAHGRAIPGLLERVEGDAATVRLLEPERGVAPGQVIAFYDGDRVLGGGTIASSAK